MSTFSIAELADRSNVTIRTIRYYVSEGLLPSPGGKGRYAKYGPEHLDRLALIAKLKEAFLPLREIRRRMSALSDRDVSELLSSGQTAPWPAAAQAEVGEDALADSKRSPWIRYRFEDGLELHVTTQLHPWRERIVRRIVAEIQSHMQDW